MIDLFYKMTFYGNFIINSDLENISSLKIDNYFNKGDFNKRRQITQDYSYITVTPINRNYNLTDFINECTYIKQKLTIELISDIELDILIAYKDQCNHEIQLDEIKSIYEFGCSLSISCYESDDVHE